MNWIPIVVGRTKRYTAHKLIQNFLQRTALPPAGVLQLSGSVSPSLAEPAGGFSSFERHPGRRWRQSHNSAAGSGCGRDWRGRCGLRCSCSHTSNTQMTTAAVAVAQSRVNTSSCSRCRWPCRRRRRSSSRSAEGAAGKSIVAPTGGATATLGTRGNLGGAVAAATADAASSPDASGAATSRAAGADDVAPATAEEAATAIHRRRLRASAAATCSWTMPPLLERLHGPSLLALLTAPRAPALEFAICSLDVMARPPTPPSLPSLSPSPPSPLPPPLHLPPRLATDPPVPGLRRSRRPD